MIVLQHLHHQVLMFHQIQHCTIFQHIHDQNLNCLLMPIILSYIIVLMLVHAIFLHLRIMHINLLLDQYLQLEHSLLFLLIFLGLVHVNLQYASLVILILILLHLYLYLYLFEYFIYFEQLHHYHYHSFYDLLSFHFYLNSYYLFLPLLQFVII